MSSNRYYATDYYAKTLTAKSRTPYSKSKKHTKSFAIIFEDDIKSDMFPWDISSFNFNKEFLTKLGKGDVNVIVIFQGEIPINVIWENYIFNNLKIENTIAK